MLSTLLRSRPLAWVAIAAVLLVGLSLLPIAGLSDRWQVVIEAARVVLGLTLLLSWLGWAIGGMLLPSQWKPYQLLLAPLLGVVILVPLAYLLNFAVDMSTGTAILAVLALPPVFWRVLRNGSPETLCQHQPVAVGLAALGLLAAALLPHVVQGSLGLLAQNGDEETYFHLARYLLAYPAGGSMPGPPSPIFGQGTDVYRAEGWGFQYLLAAASAVSGVETFDAYLPASYVLLALGVPAWYLFFREVLKLSPRGAKLAALLYAAHGLPLWFASYGYARQVAWVALAPLVLSSLALAVRSKGAGPVVFAGMVMGTFFATESRVGATHIAVTVAGLGVYWLIADRRPSFLLRLSAIGAVALTAAAPAAWYFLRSYLVTGGGVGILSDQKHLADWGPNMGGFPPLEVLLGLEPFELVRVPDQLAPMPWLDLVDKTMGAAAPYLAWVALLVACLGALISVRKAPIGLALVAGFFVWMVATRTVLPFPYGYFKLFGVASPLLLGFVVLGAEKLSDLADSRTSSPAARPLQWRLLLFGGLVLILFLARNSLHSISFGASGWGLSIPPSLVRSVAAFATATEPGARIYVTGAARYPVSADAVVTRKGHRLAMQSPEELEMVLSDRMHALIATSLVGRQVYGLFKTEQWRWDTILPDDGYDYYVLNSDEDARLRGLDPEDVVVQGSGVAMYRARGVVRAGSEQILAARGSLQVDASNPLVFRAGTESLAFGSSQPPMGGVAKGRVRIALLSLAGSVVDISFGDAHRRLALDPGLSWYTTATVGLPVEIRVQPFGPDPVRVIALRVLPPGQEDLDRSNDGYLSSQVTARDGEVDVDLWFSNPMRDAKGAWAEIVAAGGSAQERRLGLGVSERGERWLLRFPLWGGGPQQLRDGVVDVPMEQLPWVENGGGLLSLRFRLGHERPRLVPLATMAVDRGQIAHLDRYLDPVQLRLWGYDDRPSEKMPPPLSSLEGSLVRSPGGLTYVVLDGRRRWVPDPSSAQGYGGPIELSPEQLWLVPPGLPMDVTGSPRAGN